MAIQQKTRLAVVQNSCAILQHFIRDTTLAYFSVSLFKASMAEWSTTLDSLKSMMTC